jgi:hypothetical protein
VNLQSTAIKRKAIFCGTARKRPAISEKNRIKRYLEENILLYIHEKFDDGNFKILHDNH